MPDPLDSTPAADGFHMPAEWEPHAGCWMAWPERPDNWHEGAVPAQAAYTAVASAIAASEPVTMATSTAQLEAARAALPDGVRVIEVPTDDAWLRDTGPTFVVDGKGARRGIDWIFNAWGGFDGGLYAPWDRDDAVAAKVLEVEGDDRYRAPIVLEGGAIHVDGAGTVLTTEQCLLNRNRNPELDRAAIEVALHAHLGTEKVVWLGEGVFEDETDGHVDNLACFARPGLVLLTWVDDSDDPQHAISADALARLDAATDARGHPLEVIKVPAPGPLTITAAEAAGVESVAGTQPRRAGDRMAAGYVNFYLGNSRVVYPLLDPERDEEAGAILRRVFPEREAIGVPAREILLGGGNVHCITQQVPARKAG
jgi:agmatine deiminase